MAYDWKLVRQAESDLNEIVSYLSHGLSNPQAAERFLQRFQSVIAETCQFPECGSPVVNEFLPVSNIRTQLVGSYVMYYLPDHARQTVFVLRMLYGRRNLEEILWTLSE